jgi:trk system potassium uptake protein TrkA
MKVIIMGCGKVGTQVSRRMAAEGHEVTVIDPDPAALARLGAEFKGRRLTGVGFDQKVLLDAGIERAEASRPPAHRHGQHRVARIAARSTMSQVVCRLYDPRRAEIYKRLGWSRSPSRPGGAADLRAAVACRAGDVAVLRSGQVALVEAEVPPRVGRRVYVSVPGEIIVVAIRGRRRSCDPGERVPARRSGSVRRARLGDGAAGMLSA